MNKKNTLFLSLIFIISAFSFSTFSGMPSSGTSFSNINNQTTKPSRNSNQNTPLNAPLAKGTATTQSLTRYVVKFKKATSLQKKIQLHQQYGSVLNFRLIQQSNIDIIESTRNPDELMKDYSANGDILYIEPEMKVEIFTTPNDPRYSSLWGLNNTGQTSGNTDADINAQQAWDITKGSANNVIAVIDTGVDYNHEDLKDNMWVNPNEIAGDGIDNDNNGYVDDIYGIDTVNNDSDPIDDNNHGTHVAGTIAAKGNNNLGIVGVNWHAKIIACKFLSSGGSGSTIGAIKCLDYLAGLKQKGINIIASNNSWGGGGHSQALYDSIKSNQDLGILFIAAAGNSANDNDQRKSYPSSYDLSSIVSVAATDHKDQLAYFSSYGKTTVDVAAPGVSILSTVRNNSYASYSGTSMATPHVAGLVGLIKANNASLNIAQIKSLLLASGKPVSSLSDKVLSGRVIRAWDTNGRGALTCSNQGLSSRISPIANIINAEANSTITLEYSQSICENNLSSAIVQVSDGSTISLLDTGIEGDNVANDGILSSQYLFNSTDKKTLTFPNGSTVLIKPMIAYRVAKSVPYVYENMQSSTRLALSDDETVLINSPFAINFADTNMGNKLYVNANGVISFDSKRIHWTNKSLPSTRLPNMAIVPWWDDLYPGEQHLSKGVFWKTTGNSPNRKLIIEWRDVEHYYTDTGITFQVVLTEGLSDIQINYKDVVFSDNRYSSGKTSSVGIQQSHSFARQYCYNTACLSNEKSLLWQLSNTPEDYSPIVDGLSTTSSKPLVAGLSYTFTINAHALNNKSITQYQIDFNGNGSFDYNGSASQTIYGYDAIGNYIYHIKVTDSDNKSTDYYNSFNLEFDAKEIVKQAIEDYKQLILKNPHLLGLFSQADIDTQLANLRQLIQNNPHLYNLFSQTDIDASITFIQQNPEVFGLLSGDIKITSTKVQSLTKGWHLLSNPTITDIDAFESAHAVFYYKNNQYYAYSSNTELSQQFTLNNELNPIVNTIPAGLGIWIYKL